MSGKASLGFKDTITVWRRMSISKYVCNWRTNPKGEVKSLSLHGASAAASAALSEVMKYVCAYSLSFPWLPQRLWAQEEEEEEDGSGCLIKDMHEMWVRM